MFDLQEFLSRRVGYCPKCDNNSVRVDENDVLQEHSVRLRMSDWDGGEIPVCQGTGERAESTGTMKNRPSSLAA